MSLGVKQAVAIHQENYHHKMHKNICLGVQWSGAQAIKKVLGVSLVGYHNIKYNCVWTGRLHIHVFMLKLIVLKHI